MSTESRPVKIGRLKVRINQGLYRVDAIAVAEAILAHERRNTYPANSLSGIPVQRLSAGWPCVMHGRQIQSYRRPSVSFPSRGRKRNLCRSGNLKALLF